VISIKNDAPWCRRVENVVFVAVYAMVWAKSRVLCLAVFNAQLGSVPFCDPAPAFTE
jgi:hypothetical protein